MKSTRHVSWLCTLGCLLLHSSANAAVRLPAFISDHMVIQQDQPIKIWGWADPGEKVTVEIAGQKETGAADEAGRWSVTLRPLKPGTPQEMSVSGQNALVVKDILVGDLWLASGQSNMAFPLSKATNASQEIAAANYPAIRVFTTQLQFAQQLRTEVVGEWKVCSPENAASFSAVAYFFGRDLHKQLKHPVGLLVSSVGGTHIEAWIQREVLAANPDSKQLLKDWEVTPETFAKIVREYKQFQFQRDHRAEILAAAAAKGEAEPPVPVAPKKAHGAPSVLFNGMIAPLVPFAIRGVIWYQGEGNTGNGKQYRRYLADLITSWRKQWGQPDLPFYYVQLANFGSASPQPSDSGSAEVRESQRRVLAMKNTGMAVTIELGEANDVHYPRKQEVGARLALWALANLYGQSNLVYSGPLYSSVTWEEDTAILHFTQTGGGLMAKGGTPLTQFAIAAKDGKYVWADAVIAGDTVRVRSNAVPHPVSVRYAWARNPQGCNLYNVEGLPASPFSTAKEMP